MRGSLEPHHISDYARAGYCVVDDLLSASELDEWRAAVAEATAEQLSWDPATRRHWRAAGSFHNQETPGHYSQVFVQCVNMWKHNARMRELVLDPRLGGLAGAAAQMSGGVRLYHDHALIKRPWAPPTNWHIDNPGDPFYSTQACMLWVALDDATVANGCVCLLEGSHHTATSDAAGLELTIQRNAQPHPEAGGLGGGQIGGVLPKFPEWEALPLRHAAVRAGGAVFISGWVCHAAGPNMSLCDRRAMCLLYFPDGSLYNGAFQYCVLVAGVPWDEIHIIFHDKNWISD
jgi:phytanoyl-CoA hydroxylase